MIATDTSTWVAFLEGEEDDDTRLLDRALAERQLHMLPIVLAELMSDPCSDRAKLLGSRHFTHKA
jgi:uncharacterized protein with PIN domain